MSDAAKVKAWNSVFSGNPPPPPPPRPPQPHYSPPPCRSDERLMKVKGGEICTYYFQGAKSTRCDIGPPVACPSDKPPGAVTSPLCVQLQPPGWYCCIACNSNSQCAHLGKPASCVYPPGCCIYNTHKTSTISLSAGRITFNRSMGVVV